MSQKTIERLAVKTNAIRFFDEHSDLWAGRYSDPGNGLLLWDRHHSLMELIDEWQLPSSARCLDIGCGAGLLTFDLARQGLHGVGIDGAPSMVESCRLEARRIEAPGMWEYEQADVEAIPFPDQSFDAAICCGVIEYLPDDEALLQEARRILRPGGHFLLCVTNRYSYSASLYPLFQKMKRIPGLIQVASAIRGVSTGRKTMMNLPHAPRRHSPSQIKHALATHGFHIEKDRFCGFSLLPGPLNVLLSRPEKSFAASLRGLSQTRWRKLGSFYMISSRAE
jgi:ubiquinone/menaquinone biosynthesis C-methylase UbiE